MLNPFENPAIVEGYEACYETTGRRADRLEKALLQKLLDGFPAVHTLLEVGCGTGHFTRWFQERGLQAVGLDRSTLMLAEAVRLGRLQCVHGDALSLPFSNNALDIVALITTLEFIPEPVLALTEAFRVARCGLILGVLNRQSILGWRLKQEGGAVWEVARFFNPAELIEIVRNAIGDTAEIVWWTTMWPISSRSLPLPWGGFIGMSVQRR